MRIRRFLGLGGLAAGLTILAACGASPTATTAPTTAPTTAAARTVTAAAPVASPTTAASTATRTTVTSPATTTRTATTSVGTATRTTTPGTGAAGTAVRTTPGAGTATRTGSPTAGAVAPPQAVTNLQRLDNSQQAWVFSGFTVAGLTGDLRPVFEYNGGNRKVTLSAAGTNVEGYRVGGTLYARAPVVGVVPADASNPLTAPVTALFAAPDAILAALVPANATYTAAGTETVNGRQATRYNATIALTDLAFVNPALAGQRGTATTSVWVDNAQGVVVALESNIRSEGAAPTTATARLDVTNIGQTPAITVPR